MLCLVRFSLDICLPKGQYRRAKQVNINTSSDDARTFSNRESSDRSRSKLDEATFLPGNDGGAENYGIVILSSIAGETRSIVFLIIF